MAFSFIASTSAIPGANGGSTGAINSTGAALLVLEAAFYTGSTTVLTVSDSKGNVWVPLRLRNAGQAGHQYFICPNPVSVGSGHTASVTGSSTFPVVTFSAYGGRGFLEWENGAVATSGASLAGGSYTPIADNALILTGWAGMNGTSNPSVDSGVTQTTNQNPVGGSSVAGGSGYKIQTSAAAINPTWSWTGTDHVAVSSTAIWFVDPVAPLLAVTGKGSTDTFDVVTDPIDTTGATLLIAVASHYVNEPTFTDSEGNTWSVLSSGVPGDIQALLYYCENPTTSASHTFQAIGGASVAIPSLHVSAWDNFDAYDGVMDSDNAGLGFVTPDVAVTPLADHRLVISAVTFGGGTQSISSMSGGLTIFPPQVNCVGSQHVSTVVGYEIQTAAASRTIGWGWSGFSSGSAAIAAVFSAPATDARLTSQRVEALTQNAAADVRLTHQRVEAITQNSTADIRLTSQRIEVLQSTVVLEATMIPSVWMGDFADGDVWIE